MRFHVSGTPYANNCSREPSVSETGGFREPVIPQSIRGECIWYQYQYSQPYFTERKGEFTPSSKVFCLQSWQKSLWLARLSAFVMDLKKPLVVRQHVKFW